MQTHFMNVIFTNHAIERLYQRGIVQSDAWYTLKHPDGCVSGSSPGSKKFYKNYGQQRIEIVAKLNEKREWVVLSCWSKYVGDSKPIFHQPSFVEKLIHKVLDKFFDAILKKIKKKKTK